MTDFEAGRRAAREAIGMALTPREVEAVFYYLSGAAPSALAGAVEMIKEDRAHSATPATDGEREEESFDPNQLIDPDDVLPRGADRG